MMNLQGGRYGHGGMEHSQSQYVIPHCMITENVCPHDELMNFSRCVCTIELYNQYNTCVLSKRGECERSVFDRKWSKVIVNGCYGYGRLSFGR